MLSERLLNALNDQLKYEFDSSHLYLSMAAYCASQDFDGFAHFFRIQAEEERFHAMKFFDFIHAKGSNVVIKGVEEPSMQYDSILDAFEIAYEHEKSVTKRVYNLMDIATEEREHATISFLRWFVDEQVEEEASFDMIKKKIKRIKDDTNALYMLDDELGNRTYTPPKEEN